MVGRRRRRLPGGDDVRAQHGRDGRGGHAARRVRLRGEAAVARETAAHRGARPGCGPAPSPGGQAPRLPARGTDRQEPAHAAAARDRKSTRLNSSHLVISYAVFCLKKKKTKCTTTLATCAARTRRTLKL